jgi:hypothetical protein
MSLMDGASITNFAPSAGVTLVTYTPSGEAVDEFKVQQTVRLWLPGRFGIPTTIRCSKVRTPLALTCRGRGNGSAWQRSLNFFSLPHGRKLSLGEVSYVDQVFPGCQRAVPYR